MNKQNKHDSSHGDGLHPQLNHQELLASQTTLLKPLGRDAVLNYMQNGRFRLMNVTPGSTIHFEGDTCQRLEIVLEGQIVIDRIDAAGNLMTVAQCKRNEVLGGNLLFSQRPFYPMTLSAVKATTLLLIDKNLLFELLSQNPAFLKVYLELTSDRANMLGEQIRHYVNKTIRMCMVNFLKQEYGRQKTNPLILSLSKKMLAEKIGVQRTSISRELAKMRDEGLVRFDKKTVTVLDMSIFK